MALPTASDNEFPKVILEEVADDGSATVTPAADHRALFLGEDGHLHVKDSAGTVTDPYDVSGGANVGNLWTMNKSSSQTLTISTNNLITFDTAVIDGGGSVIDLANDRFVVPATGFYMAFATWLWETSIPAGSSNMSAAVGGTAGAAVVRTQDSNAANGGLSGSFPLSLTAGAFVTLLISPSSASGVTARGNAVVALATAFTLMRIT